MFEAKADNVGFQLLRVIRSYLELDLFSSLREQNTDRLGNGKAELLRFEKLLKVSSKFVVFIANSSYQLNTLRNTQAWLKAVAGPFRRSTATFIYSVISVEKGSH